MHAVERADPGGPGGQQADLQAGQQRQPILATAGMERLGEVRRPHDERADPGTGARDGRRVEDAARGLQHAPHRGRGAQHVQRRGHGVRGLDLGEQDRVHGGVGDGGQIVGAPRRAGGIHPHDDLARTVAAGPHRRQHLGARGGLRLGRDRVLQIQDERVGGQGAGLLERPRVRAGHEQHAPPRGHRGRALAMRAIAAGRPRVTAAPAPGTLPRRSGRTTAGTRGRCRCSGR